MKSNAVNNLLWECSVVLWKYLFIQRFTTVLGGYSYYVNAIKLYRLYCGDGILHNPRSDFLKYIPTHNISPYSRNSIRLKKLNRYINTLIRFGIYILNKWSFTWQLLSFVSIMETPTLMKYQHRNINMTS